MIIAKNITKKYKLRKKKEFKIAVNNVSFHINNGDIVGYIGPNGAGKSTMIKMLCGILEPTEGEVIVNQLNPAKYRKIVAKQIGVVFGQRTQLWWDLPLIDSYRLLKTLYNISDTDFNERLEYFDSVFNISNHFNSLVRTLSLGERMKADIVASMIHCPKILFLDEPTIGLDFLAKRKMHEAIKDLHTKYNTTIFLTSHDMDDISELCNRIIIIDEGIKIYDDYIENMKNEFGKLKIIEFSLPLEYKNRYGEIKDIISTKIENIKFTESEDKYTLLFNTDNIKPHSIIKIISDVVDSANIILKDISIEKIVERIYNLNEEKKQ